MQRLLEDRHAERGTVSKAVVRRVARAVERKAEGAALIEKWGLERWLRPR